MVERKDVPLQWPSDKTFYLTLDFECDYGTALTQNKFQSIRHVNRLISILEELQIPLTCFIQTEILDDYPNIVDSVTNSDVPVVFHPHSHTHPSRAESSTIEEVELSTRTFQNFFGNSPVGYRFPNGNIHRDDYQILSEYGYEFSASVFPTWRPAHFNNITKPTIPFRVGKTNIIEIPFTTMSPIVRIPTALSYCRVMGRPYMYYLTHNPPEIMIFNIHMHDLINPESFDELPLLYKLVYSRNDQGFSLLTDILSDFKGKNYTFDVLDTVVTSI